MKICIIPARSGSKRIKNKNIRKFLGKPIIGLVLQSLKKMKFFEIIIVTTDHKKIANISKKYGADVILYRDKKLLKDHVGTCEIVSNSIKKIRSQNIFPSFVFAVYPTSVFLEKKYLQHAIRILKKNNSSFVFSAIKYPHPIQRSFFYKKNKLIQNFTKHKKTQTQKLISNYFDAGQFYLAKPEKWMKFDNVFQRNSMIVEIPYNECKDIDEIEDWKLAELIFKSYKKKN